MATDTFPGAAAPLANPPWVQIRDGGGTTVDRDGFGNAVPSVDNTEVSVRRDDGTTWDDDQYSQVKVHFSGPGDGTQYLALVVRQSGTFVGLNDQKYLFESDGGSDSQIYAKVANTFVTLSGGAAIDNSITFADGDVIRLSVVGTDLTVTKNGAVILTGVDNQIASGSPGFGMSGAPAADCRISDWSGGNLDASVHVVSGRGSEPIATPAWLSIEVEGRPNQLTAGNAEPPNWYHVGLLRWGTGNGAMAAYPITADLDLVALPAGMDTLWYSLATGVTITVTELAAP